MKWRGVLLFVSGIAMYVYLGYLALERVPESIIRPESFHAISDTAVRERLIIDAQGSVRTSSIALLTSSALGVSGLIAVLTLSSSKRDSERVLRTSQDELYSRSLEILTKDSDAATVGAISTMSAVAKDRLDLRPSTLSILFVLIRTRRRLTAPIQNVPDKRSCGDMIDRDPVTASAFRLLGELLRVGREKPEVGAITRRRLDGCDFRRMAIDGGRFELVNFVGSVFWDGSYMDCEFVKCAFSQTDWVGARLRRVTFRECDMALADFSGATFAEVEFDSCAGRP